MAESDDISLLKHYIEGNSEAAFGAVVERHVHLVYSTALRQVGNPSQAEEITQAVFIILARKAERLSSKTILSGWLYQTARLTAANFRRSEIRRQQREQESYMQSTLAESDAASWEELAPRLEEAMGCLGETERDAIVLRFFENKTAEEVAATLKLEEVTARKRVSHALEKLRRFFAKRGVSSTTAVIAKEISTNSVLTAPAALAKSVTVVATAKGATALASTAALAKGTMKTMTWLKMKLCLGIAAAALAAAGITTIAISPPQPTVYSLLEKPPIIASASYELERNVKMLPPGFPASATNQTVTFSLDGENYRMDFGGGMAGEYGDLLWRTIGEQLTTFNLKWNKPEQESGGVTAQDLAARRDIKLLLTSGITISKPQNIKWEAGHKKMTFEMDDGKKYKYDVDFEEENGKPVNASIRDDSTGKTDGFVVYRYAPEFCEGRLPVEITRYYGATANENAKVWVIRIKSLKFSKHHLSASILDPNKFIQATNPDYMPLFYSNNLLYWTDAKGKARRVLTAEENAAALQKLHNKR